MLQIDHITVKMDTEKAIPLLLLPSLGLTQHINSFYTGRFHTSMCSPYLQICILEQKNLKKRN